MRHRKKFIPSTTALFSQLRNISVYVVLRCCVLYIKTGCTSSPNITEVTIWPSAISKMNRNKALLWCGDGFRSFAPDTRKHISPASLNIYICWLFILFSCVRLKMFCVANWQRELLIILISVLQRTHIFWGRVQLSRDKLQNSWEEIGRWWRKSGGPTETDVTLSNTF